MNPEHPPLAKLVASLPLLIVRPNLPEGEVWARGDEWGFGDAFLYANRFPAKTLLLLGRLPLILVSLLFPYLIYRWLRDVSTSHLALAGFFLAAFEPTFLAHSRYVTTDVPVTIASFATLLAFVRFLEQPRWGRLLLAAALLGAAVATKFSALLLVPTLLVLLFIRRWQIQRFAERSAARLFTFRVAAVLLLVSAVFVWATYGFEWRRPIDDPRVQSLLAQGEDIRASGLSGIDDPLLRSIIRTADPATPSGSTLVELIRDVHLPGYSFIRGVVQLISHNRGGHASYLLGETGNDGWWYYFPLAFLVKTPLSLLVLAALSLGALVGGGCLRVWRRGEAAISIRTWALVIFSLGYFAVSLTSHINLGVRHLLPLYPSIIIAGCLVIRQLIRRYKFTLYGMAAAAAISSMSVFPFFLTYFNEAAGGPAAGPKYLLDSNLDWGQDASRLGQYLAARDEEVVCLAYFGRAPIGNENIAIRSIPLDAGKRYLDGTLPCTVAVSATILFSSNEQPFVSLRDLTPSERVGYSIYTFENRPSLLLKNDNSIP